MQAVCHLKIQIHAHKSIQNPHLLTLFLQDKLSNLDVLLHTHLKEDVAELIGIKCSILSFAASFYIDAKINIK